MTNGTGEAGGGGVVVVGGTSGIGASVVRQRRAGGADVITWDLAGDPDVRCDIADEAQVAAATTATIDRLGVPTEVTVTAGIGHAGLLVDVTPDDWDRVFAVNVRGVWSVLRALVQPMIAGGEAGSFVVVSSVSAELVDRNMGAYCASKAALDMVVRVAAAEWGVHGIRVNAVAPGVTRTPMLGRVPDESAWLTGVRERTALGRIGTADEVAEAIVAVHGLTWVTGQVLAADGGLSLQSPIDSYAEVLRHQRGTDDS